MVGVHKGLDGHCSLCISLIIYNAQIELYFNGSRLSRYCKISSYYYSLGNPQFATLVDRDRKNEMPILIQRFSKENA